MTTEQALQILDLATQPGAKFSRADYLAVEQALHVLRTALKIGVEDGKLANSTTDPY